MKKKFLFYIVAGIASAFTYSSYGSLLISVDLGRAQSWVPIQSGFTKIGSAASATTISSTAGDISVGFTWGASAPNFWSADVMSDSGEFTYSNLYDSYFESNNVSAPLNLVLSGAGIAANSEYQLRVFSMEPNGNPGRITVFTPTAGTLGSPVSVNYTAPIGGALPSNFQNSSLLELTSSSSGILTIQITPDTGLGGDDRVIFNGFQLTAVPEPSTYAALFGAFALVVVMVRRRKAIRSNQN